MSVKPRRHPFANIDGRLAWSGTARPASAGGSSRPTELSGGAWTNGQAETKGDKAVEAGDRGHQTKEKSTVCAKNGMQTLFCAP
jgi:hypothetical protein